MKNVAALFGGILIASLGVHGAVEAQKHAPNIILIYADDLDGDELGHTYEDSDIWPTFNGAFKNNIPGLKKKIAPVHTPNIDKLAENGMVFERFYVNGTVCTSSRYSLMTGRFPTRGKELQEEYPPGGPITLEWRPSIIREESSISKELKKLGYRTGIVGKWHNLPHDVFYPKPNKQANTATPSYEMVQKHENELKAWYKRCHDFLIDGFGWDVVDRMEWGNSIVNLDWQAEGAVKFIEDNKDKPFFLYVPLPVPHGQYSFGYNTLSNLDPRVSSIGILPKIPGTLPPDEDVLARVDEAGVPRESAMATHMDDYVGALMDKVEELGLSEETLIIYTSDHGSRGKNSVYEGGARVPMFAYWPGVIPAGKGIRVFLPLWIFQPH